MTNELSTDELAALPVATVDDLIRVMDRDPRPFITGQFREAVSALTDPWERPTEHPPTPEMLEVGDTFVPCVSTTAVVRIVADYLSAVLPDLLAEAEARGAEVERLRLNLASDHVERGQA